MSTLSNQELYEELGRFVAGHKEAKKSLITMLGRSRLRNHQKFILGMESEHLLNPMKILLIGASGTGKTFLIESLQKIIHFPFVRVDATQMNPAGSSGGVKSDDLKKMIVREAAEAVKNYPWQYFSVEGAVDQTVVFIDEIDKLGASWESSGNWNKHVQSNFLTMFDNKLEYAGVSFVFAGAFDSITREKLLKKNIGFNHNGHTDKRDLIDNQILKSGLIPELVGRINSIVELDVFNQEQLYDILVNRILPKKQMDLAAYRIFDLAVTDDQLQNIAKDCAESGQGIRYMQRALDRLFLDVEFNVDIEDILFKRG